MVLKVIGGAFVLGTCVMGGMMAATSITGRPYSISFLGVTFGTTV